MVKSIIFLIVFSAGLIWAIVDLVRLKHRNFDEEYKQLYIENKTMLALIFFAAAIMQAEKLWSLCGF